MTNRLFDEASPTIATLDDLAALANYSLMDTLNCDPDATENGEDRAPRQVFTGHYVPVKPTPIDNPEYIYPEVRCMLTKNRIRIMLPIPA